MGDLVLLSFALIWGATFTFIKAALDQIAPFSFLTLRFGLAGLLLLPAWLRLPPERRRTLWGPGLGLGLFLFLGYAFQTVGLRTTTATKSAFITGLYVVFVPLLEALALRRPPRLRVWIAVAMAVVGLGAMTLEGTGWDLGMGDLWTLLCALAFAVQILLVDRWAHHDPLALGALQIGVVALLSLPIALAGEPFPPLLAPAVVQGVLFTGLLATALALPGQIWAQRRVPPHRAALLFTLEPVFALAVAALFLGEIPLPRQLAGAVLVVAGMALAELGRT